MQKLHDLFEYDPLTGVIRWKISRGRSLKGSPAGSLNNEGYRYVQVDGKKLPASSIAWFLTHGVWLLGVDHEDRDRDNNRLINLRKATHSQNCLNRKREQKSGFKGVYPKNSRWEAKITLNGKTERLGMFDTPEEASIAYRNRAASLHGEFSCV